MTTELRFTLGWWGRMFRGRAALVRASPGVLLRVVLAGELRRLGPTLVPCFLHDRRHLGVGDEALPARRVPVEEHPDTILLGGITEDGRTLGPVLLPLLGALGREDLLEAVEILDLRRCQDHRSPPLALGLAARCRWCGECTLRKPGPSRHRTNAYATPRARLSCFT